MTQTYYAPFDGDDGANLVIKPTLPATLATLRDHYRGATEPTSPIEGQFWEDTTTGLLKYYDGSTWWVLAPLGGYVGGWGRGGLVASLSATDSLTFWSAPCAGIITELRILSETATSGSSAGATEWQWEVYNVTQAQALFSGTVGTGTSLGGVGGGELAVETEYLLTVDQNPDVAAADVLRVTATKVGSPTSPLTNVHFEIRGYPNGL